MEHYRKLERMYAVAPVNRFFQPTMTVEEGTAEIEMPVGEHLFHTAGAMHGSAYFKCLDDAAFFAANSLVTEVFVLTHRFEVELLKPVLGPRVRAVGIVTGQTERRILAEAILYDHEGAVVARGSGTFARSRIRLTPEVHYM